METYKPENKQVFLKYEKGVSLAAVVSLLGLELQLFAMAGAGFCVPMTLVFSCLFALISVPSLRPNVQAAREGETDCHATEIESEEVFIFTHSVNFFLVFLQLCKFLPLQFSSLSIFLLFFSSLHPRFFFFTSLSTHTLSTHILSLSFLPPLSLLHSSTSHSLHSVPK
ncbi:MAG: hypothetical protein JOS17DRAFT_342012 [Linnemannia elongata]|nr:MAG: hypothetical protein JOS17DRAFT_342012 [Linnemannia elongata]